MEIKKFERTQNLKDLITKRNEVMGSLNTELLLLVDRINSESKKYDNKILYAFSPSASVVFLDVRDRISYKNNTEIYFGIFRISTINVVYCENSKDDGTKFQEFELKFLCDMMEVNKEEDGSHKVLSADCFRPSYKIGKIVFDDKMQFIEGSQQMYFLEKVKYEECKDFIQSVKRELKIN